jgi:hypothetical protein
MAGSISRLPVAALGFTLGSSRNFRFDEEGPAGVLPGWPLNDASV